MLDSIVLPVLGNKRRPKPSCGGHSLLLIVG
jgi:hypothetical protein